MPRLWPGRLLIQTRSPPRSPRWPKRFCYCAHPASPLVRDPLACATLSVRAMLPGGTGASGCKRRGRLLT